jgi:hypothetical protein
MKSIHKGYAEGDARPQDSDTLNTGLSERLKLVRKHLAESQTGMDSLLNIGKKSWQRYESGGHTPGSQVVAALVEQGFNANWVLSGDGPMLLEDAKPAPEAENLPAVLDELRTMRQELRELNAENKQLMHENNDLRGILMEKNIDPERDFTVSVVNFERENLSGWHRVVSTPMFAFSPVDIFKHKGFALIMRGYDLAPMHIEPDHIIFFTPELNPYPGDIVFVERKDSLATVAIFEKITADKIDPIFCLSNWLPHDPMNPNRPQERIALRVPNSDIKMFATAVYIKRR